MNTSRGIFQVRCPSCSTEFSIDSGKVPENGVAAICSVCLRVFPVHHPAEAAGGETTSIEAFDPSVAGGVIGEGLETALEETAEVADELSEYLDDEVVYEVEVIETGLVVEEFTFVDETVPPVDEEDTVSIGESVSFEDETEVEGPVDETHEGFVALPDDVEAEPAEEQAEAVPEPEAEREFAPEAEPETEFVPEPEFERVPEPEFEHGPELVPEVEFVPEPDAEFAPEPATETEFLPETEIEYVPEPEPEVEFAPEAEREAEYVAEPEIESAPEAEPEPVAEALPVHKAAPIQERRESPREKLEFEDLSSFTNEVLAEAETAPPVVESTRPAPEKVERFGRRDPHERARHLARVLVSDIIAYYPVRYQESLARRTLPEDFADEIQKSYREFVDQVGIEMAESTPYFVEALNHVLGRGEKFF